MFGLLCHTMDLQQRASINSKGKYFAQCCPSVQCVAHCHFPIGLKGTEDDRSVLLSCLPQKDDLLCHIIAKPGELLSNALCSTRPAHHLSNVKKHSQVSDAWFIKARQHMGVWGVAEGACSNCGKYSKYSQWKTNFCNRMQRARSFSTKSKLLARTCSSSIQCGEK